MRKSLNQKIIILRNILNQYSNYFKYFDFCTCYLIKHVECRLNTRRKMQLYVQNRNVYTILDNEHCIKPYRLQMPVFCVYFTNQSETGYKFLKRYIPIGQIDKIISRYRAKLYNEVKKYTRSDIKDTKICRFIPDKVYVLKMFD